MDEMMEKLQEIKDRAERRKQTFDREVWSEEKATEKLKADMDDLSEIMQLFNKSTEAVDEKIESFTVGRPRGASYGAFRRNR